MEGRFPISLFDGRPVLIEVKTILDKEFQYFVESQLIEVKNMKMQMIQFVSRMNLIQMKLMKVIHIIKK
jgi:hypothetical protein